MTDAWFTEFADELARLLAAARASAEACEAYLAVDGSHDAVDALVAAIAVSRVLSELIDQPSQIVLAAVLLCRDLSTAAAAQLDEAVVVGPLERVAASAGELLAAIG